MEEVDLVRLNFKPESLVLLNFLLGLIMFGVAIDLKISDFKWVMKAPKAPVIGLIAQFLLLPALTYGLTLLIDPAASIALGMMLVAACPGGNISNIMTHLARGNTALSISMTAVSTVGAVFMTPLNVAFWGSLNPKTDAILKEVQLDPLTLFVTVSVVLGIPLIGGLFVSHRFPKFAQKARKPMRIIAFVFFFTFVGIALGNNWSNFINYIGLVMFAVLLHNALALLLGYTVGRASGLGEKNSRAVSIEVGIQNSGLGLILIFTFFEGLGGMALIAAWWGIWHIISGLAVATMWSFLSRDDVPAA